MRIIVVATESTWGLQALYIGGQLQFTDDSILATDLARLAGPGPVFVKLLDVHLNDQDSDQPWPEDLNDLLTRQPDCLF